MNEHVSVLLDECINALNIHEDGIYIDATLGRAGHSKAILAKLKKGHLYAFDKDQEAIDKCRHELQTSLDRVTLIHADFIHLKEELNKFGIQEVDGILFDLGVSSPQFDEASRGFSYRFDARLDMRMDQSQALDAYQVINQYEESELRNIFWQYGEEHYAHKIAHRIVERRKIKPISTTFELVEIIKECLPSYELRKKKHPAKQVFQAIRMAVNDELNHLAIALEEACDLLSVKGRLAIISFHSIEDRVVKNILKKHCEQERPDSRIAIKESDIPQADFSLINKKPIVASDQELSRNRRSHSAKLRIIERRKKSNG